MSSEDYDAMIGRQVSAVEGIEYCVTHGGVLMEGTDECEYGFIDSSNECDGAELFYRPSRQ